MHLQDNVVGQCVDKKKIIGPCIYWTKVVVLYNRPKFGGECVIREKIYRLVRLQDKKL
jgi:hypothetical protein